MLLPIFWVLGCSEPRPQPWLQAEPSGQELTGSFHATIDDALPGSGWVTGEAFDARDAARAFVREPRGHQPVVVVQIYGRGSEGWDLFELDVPLAFWVAGSIPLDGHAGTGLLTLADGSEQVVLEGTLNIDLPGSQPGEPAAAWFEGLSLGVVP